MIYLLLVLMAQTLSPPPINFTREVVATPEGNVAVEWDGKTLRIYPPSQDAPFPIRYKEGERFNWSACGGCLLVLTFGGIFWGTVIWWFFLK